jgi:hypothetical protein
MANPKIIDIDVEFEDVEFDEESINRATGVIKRRENGWYEANSARLKDPEYRKRLSNSLKNSEAVKEANRIKGTSESFRDAISKGLREYIDSPDYVHPRGMLGKKHTDERNEYMSELLSGRPKSLEHNQKVSEARKGKKPKPESVEKMRKKLLGRESGRSRQVQTPAGVFNKLKDAAEHYGVAPESIKNYISGQNVKEWFKPQLEAKGVTFDGLKPLGFSWLGDAKNELGAKRVKTPDGIFDDIKLAAKFYNVGPNTIRYRIKSQPEKYQYVKK